MPFRPSFRLLAFALAATAAAPAIAADDQPRLLRWTEDYSSLRVKPRPFPASLKFIPLSDDEDIYLTLGGEVRTRIEAYDHPAFGLGAGGAFASWQSRALIHADVHAGADRRLFVQLGASDERGREPGERAFDESALDVQLLFADIGTPETFQVRVGRQEIAFSGGRNAAVRDATNIRRAFDGIKLGVAREDYAIDAFVTSVVKNEDGAFDDSPNDDEQFWGVYATTQTELVRDANLDVFYLARRREAALFVEGTGEETRHMIGTRLAMTRGPYDLDAQAAIQFGRFGDGDISAWHLVADAGYTPEDTDLSPRFSVRLELASGDGTNGDGDLGTYDPLYPNGTYVTDASLLLPGNSVDLQPAVSITPMKGVKLTGGIDLFWRMSNDDGVYQPSGLLAGAGGSGSFVSAQPFVRATWRPSPRIEVSAALSHATAGEVIDSAGGEAVTYGMMQVALRF